MVGLNSLRSLFRPKRFYESMIHYTGILFSVGAEENMRSTTAFAKLVFAALFRVEAYAVFEHFSGFKKKKKGVWSLVTDRKEQKRIWIA